MNRSTGKLLSLLLAAVMLLSLGVGAAPARAAERLPVDAGEPVRMIVELEAPKAFPLSLFAPTPSRAAVKDAIRELVETASPLSAKGEAAPEVTFGYDYSVLLQGFSLTAPEGYLDEIRAVRGVRNAFVAQTYTLAEPEGGWGNADSQAAIGAQEAHARGYTGEGQVIAVLDTMLLPEHEAFSGAVPNPKLSRADVAEKLSALTIGEETTADELWHSDKIPFCYDYFEHDADTTSENPHGTHVSGIAVANGGEILGVAPDAQLLYMKVFDQYNSSGEDAILAALEDAVVLGADCVNMSLGLAGGFSSYAHETMQRVYENLRAADVTLCCSAGNDGPYSTLGWPTPIEMPDCGTVGSPSTYPAALSVANLTMKFYSRLHAGEQDYYVVDASTGSAGTIPPLSSLGDAVLPAVDCGTGSEFPAEAAGAAVFLDLRDYWDGYGPMYLRAQEAGAALIVFCLDDTWQYASGFEVENGQAPLAFISYDAAQEILAGSAGVCATGETIAAYPPDNMTSWGPSAGLELKPEIAAIGGEVYSSVTSDTNAYERMSGTSMASPQTAGALALLRQYLRGQDYDTPLTLTQLAETLLMCSATPVTDPVNGGGFVSPLRQGAGLANILSAMDAKAWISVPDSERPKAELGAGEGPFTFSFTIHNLTDDALRYRSEVLALSQDQEDGRFALSSTNYAGRGVDVQIDDVISVPAGGEKTVTVTLTVNDAFREAVAAAENGVFLDGFVRLYAEQGSGSDLGLPYMAFAGDWNAAPLLDLEGLREAPHLTNFHGTTLGTNPVEMVEYVDEFGFPVEEPYVDPEAVSISPMGKLLFSGFVGRTVLLRPASYVCATMTNEAGDVIRQYEAENVRRCIPSSDNINWKYVEAQLPNAASCYAADASGEWLPEGWYTYTVTARLAGGEREDHWSQRIYCDWTEPTLDYEISGEPGARTLTVTASDNFKLSYFALLTPESWLQSPDTLAITDRGLEQERYASFPGVQRIEKADGVYTLTLDLEAFLQDLEQRGLRTDVLKLEAKDYADNTATQVIALSEDFYPLSLELDPPELYFAVGEETQLRAILLPEGSAHDRVTWRSEDPEIATVDENGVVRAVSEGWTQIVAEAETPEGAPPMVTYCPVMTYEFHPTGYQITFDPTGGECPIPFLYTIEADGLPNTLLSYPIAEREGYTFLGWFLEPEGGEPLEPFYLFEGDATLYAHWEPLVTPTPTPTEPTPTPTPEPTPTPTTAPTPTETSAPQSCDGGDQCPSRGFADVDRNPDKWYHVPVDWAVVKNITRGRDETHFAPAEPCTRAEAVTFLYRAAGSPTVQNEASPFTDVKEGSFCHDAVLWAVQQGITRGVTAERFAPNEPCTRAHIVTFLFRAAGAVNPYGVKNPFADVKDGSFCHDAVLWAVDKGVTKGVTETRFAPNEPCTRAMIVTFLYRAQ